MANEEHLSLIKQGVQIWNRWREEQPSIAPDLSDADLKGANLEGADLTEANLEGANLQESRLDGADLRDAKLRWAHLEMAQLRKVDLRWAQLDGAILRGAHLQKADLEGAYLRWTHLEGAHLEEADLRWAHLEGADLRGAKLREAKLRWTHLERADLKRAYLIEAHLEGANLEGANLEGAHLREADLRWAHLEMADFREANLEGADLEGAHLMFTDGLDTTPTIEGFDCGELTIEYSGSPLDAMALGILHVNLQQIVDRVTASTLEILDPMLLADLHLGFRSHLGYDRLSTDHGPVVRVGATYVRVDSLTETFSISLHAFTVDQILSNSDVRAVVQNLAAAIVWTIGFAAQRYMRHQDDVPADDRLAARLGVSEISAESPLKLSMIPRMVEELTCILDPILENNLDTGAKLRISQRSPSGTTTSVLIQIHGDKSSPG